MASVARAERDRNDLVRREGVCPLHELAGGGEPRHGAAILRNPKPAIARAIARARGRLRLLIPPGRGTGIRGIRGGW